MKVLLRIATAATAALLLAAPGAFAAVTVTHHQQAHTPPGPTATALTVTGDLADDDVTIVREQAGTLLLSRTGAGITAVSASPPDPSPCVAAGADIRCPAVQAISADLGVGTDALSAPTVDVPLAIAGGDGIDRLTGGLAGDVLAGGAGNDELNGGPGIDEYFGEGDGDTIVSRDGVPERISCGNGDDRVDNDFTDIIAECERGTDNDLDGFSTAVDCDDTRRTVFPGAPDAVENGVDEDCDGQDDRNLDRDGDSFPVPLDCNDGDAAIRPGTFEIRGNDVDENCDQRALPFAPLASLVSTKWQLGPTVTRLRKLIVRNAPAGARVGVTCKGPGCRFSDRKSVTVKRDLAPVRLHPFFGKGRLRSGARVEVTITADGMIGRRYRYLIERNVLPAAVTRCLQPGSRTRTRAC